MNALIKFSFYLVAFMFPILTFASGMITVSGKLTSITKDSFVVETQQSVYTIKRSAVSPAVAEKLERTETQVSLAVPFDGIERVKPKVLTPKAKN